MTDDQRKRYFSIAREVRKFEIDKFWQRSLFFWGFIAATFVAYAKAAESQDPNAKALIACFGIVCSMAWTLSNRGSKYWQETWEKKVEKYEQEVLGDKLFAEEECLKRKGFWGHAKFSVSKQVVALSDFTVLVWIALALNAMGNLTRWHVGRLNVAQTAFTVTIIYALLLLCGRQSKR